MPERNTRVLTVTTQKIYVFSSFTGTEHFEAKQLHTSTYDWEVEGHKSVQKQIVPILLTVYSNPKTRDVLASYKTKSKRNEILDDQIVTKPVEIQVTIPKLPYASTVMVKVLC